MADDAGRAAAYRRAADYLARALEHPDPYQAILRVAGAYDTWPESLEGHPAEGAILHIYDEQRWEDSTVGMRWLAQAARLRLLVEAHDLDPGPRGVASPAEALGMVVVAWLEEVNTDGR